jgi:hypothetical protein
MSTPQAHAAASELSSYADCVLIIQLCSDENGKSMAHKERCLSTNSHMLWLCNGPFIQPYLRVFVNFAQTTITGLLPQLKNFFLVIGSGQPGSLDQLSSS